MPEYHNLIGKFVYIDKQEFVKLTKVIKGIPKAFVKASKFLKTIDFNLVKLFFAGIAQAIKDNAFDFTIDSFEDSRNQLWLPIHSPEQNTEPFLLIKHFDDDEVIALVVNKRKSFSYAVDEHNLCVRRQAHVDDKDKDATSFLKFYHTSDLVIVPITFKSDKDYAAQIQTNLFEKYYDYPLFLQSLSNAFANVQIGSNTYKAAPPWLKHFIESCNIVR